MPPESMNKETAASNSAIWLRIAQGLAKRAGCERAVSVSLGRLEAANPETITALIAGAPNSGKSTVLNQLLGRKLLPVSPVQSLMSFAVEGVAAGEPERFFIANAARPLGQLTEALRAAEKSAIPVRITLDCPWLTATRLRLAEPGPLDADVADLAALIGNSLRHAEIAVLAIDALTPVRKGDAEFLRECGRRGIPLVVTLTKVDSLEPGERQDVLAYVRAQVDQLCPGCEVLDGSGSLRKAIEDLIARTDFAELRFEQFRHSLQMTLETIAAAAGAGAEAQSRTQQEREAEIAGLRNKIDAQNLVWMRMEQELNSRREAMEQQIRSHLEANQDKTLDFLYYDLEKTGDVKAWWERDLPFRLRNELRAQTASISSAIDRQLASDRKWLQEELHRQFQYPLTIDPDTTLRFETKEITPRKVEIADAQKLRTITRFGTAGVVLIAGTLLGGAGIGGAMMATSVLTGLAGETWNHHQTKQNRDKIRGELRNLIGRSCIAFAADVSDKIRSWYDEVIDTVRACQAEWQQSRMEALEAARRANPKGGSAAEWKSLVDETNSLIAQIRGSGTAAWFSEDL